jgi:hypothetical protein
MDLSAARLISKRSATAVTHPLLLLCLFNSHGLSRSADSNGTTGVEVIDWSADDGFEECPLALVSYETTERETASGSEAVGKVVSGE